MKKIRRILKPTLLAISIIIFVIITRLLLIDKLSYFDSKVYEIVTSIKCKPVTMFFRVITVFSNMWFVMLLTAIIMIISRNKKRTFYISLNYKYLKYYIIISLMKFIICFLLNQVFKFIFTRERPLGINLISEKGYSFPSGHSMISVAFYGFLAYMYLHSNKSRKNRLITIIAFAILALLIGISRIYLGVHYASDVLAGFALSLAYLIIYVSLFYNEKKRF